MMENIDCLLVHIPKHAHMGVPFGECSSIQLMPMGLLALADRLRRHDFTVRVLHLGVEMARDPRFSLPDYVREHRVKCVGLTLHWHHQSYDVIEAARAIKRHDGDAEVKVFAGGITASFFAEQILSFCPEMDAVVMGDAYTAIVEAVRGLLSGDEMPDIPNVAARSRLGEIYLPRRYDRLDPAQYKTMGFLDLSLLENWPGYLKMPWVWLTEDHTVQNETSPLRLPLPIGIGCAHACVYCGGCGEQQMSVFGRRGVMYRSPEDVVASVLEAARFGVHRFHICFNPGGRSDDEYYLRLFEMLCRRQLALDVSFECWGLPSEEFIEAFHRTFLPESVITISPETGVEAIRHANKAMSFSNADLDRCAGAMDSRNVNSTLFFTVGLPDEEPDHIRATGVWQRNLIAKYPKLAIVSMPIELEPGSPMFRYPETFGITVRRSRFSDFCQAHGQYQPALGYDTAHMKEQTILSLGRQCLLGYTFF